MDMDRKPRTLAEIEEAIRVLQRQRETLLTQNLEPLKADIQAAYDALLKKVQQVQAIQRDYLPPWKERPLIRDFEAD